MPDPNPELSGVMAAIELAGHYPQLRECYESWGIHSAATRDNFGQLRAPVLWTFLDANGRWVVGTGLDADYFHVPVRSDVATVSIELLRTMGKCNRIPEEVIDRYHLVRLDPSPDEEW